MAEFEVGSSSKLRTPPPRPPANLDLTPEQVKRFEINRLKAKAKQREREHAASSSSALNPNKKRPLEVVAASSTSPTAPKPEAKLRRDSRLGKYFEYDLSKMVNSKGGFLLEDDKEADAELRAKERERERERAKKALEPPIFLDPAKNPKCKDCGSVDIDHTFRKVFGCLVCNTCKNAKPEKYSLLTKTECKEDYLLTDGELKDEEIMPHLLKANPHKSTFANMMLFLRYQVEEFAWTKWGSPEALDAEYERRVSLKSKKKNKKFEDGLKELRRRTRETVWQRRKDQEHKHVFGVVEKDLDGVGKQVCHECGFTIDSQVAHTLEVEQLDSNLFRSLAKHLFLPFRSRGIFGGQVISQALVSATNTVDPAYALHSMHCYFLLSATPAPILYHVDRVRNGRSYCTRAVRAYQSGQMVFIIICSFQIPETWQPSKKPTPPNGVPRPDQCAFAWEDALKRADEPGCHSKKRAYLIEWAQERQQSFVLIKNAGWRIESNGDKVWMYWFKVEGMPACNSAYQKCILGYISDYQFIGVAGKTMGLESTSPPGPTRLGLMSSLDHSIFFYNNDFDCGQWMLYMIHSPSIGSGRGVVFGRMYTESGDLIALMTQEGVTRADIRDPSKAKL
ncbi:thioesterase-like superfamily-domain-containing protein [Cytidiella melzeri]|nr:thioesterase-like superfamily-domain-containing protein [Cytidiella melzeri]